MLVIPDYQVELLRSEDAGRIPPDLGYAWNLGEKISNRASNISPFSSFVLAPSALLKYLRIVLRE
jgi:hypothetical protein